jgi:EpsI family protein
MITRAIVLCFVIVAGGAYARVGARSDVPVARTQLSAFPCSVEGWRCTDDTPLDADSLAVLRADDYLNRGYEDAGGRSASLFIAYYDSQRQGDAIHSPLNCLPGSGWEPLTTTQINLGRDVPAPANELIVEKGLDRDAVVYWYQGRGRRVANEYANRFWLVADAIRLHRSDGALVRVVSRTPDAAEQFARALGARLTPYLP